MKKKNRQTNFLDAAANPNKIAYMIISMVLIGFIGYLIYSNIFDNTTHYDDYVWKGHPAIRDITNLKAIFGINPLRFVAFLSFAFNYDINQLDPGGYYVFNLIIHIANSLLVWLLLLLTFETPAVKDYEINKYKRVFALIGALIFLTHPLQTESVSYIYQRLTSMSAFFYFLSLCFYVKARMTSNNKRLRNYLFAFAGIA